MKRSVTAFALIIAVSGAALAQADKDHQQHHPGDTAPQAQPAPPPSPAPAPPASAAAPPAQGQMPMQMMQNMPEQCRSMMQNMQMCMGMMSQMMQGRQGSGMMGGGMMGGGMMGGGMGQQGSRSMPGMSAQAALPSAATKAYLEAAERMHAPMMEGVKAGDPDTAFVRGMIPHHQAAIDMAMVVLKYGKDAETKKWAADVVREQQREITEMQEWLKKNTR